MDDILVDTPVEELPPTTELVEVPAVEERPFLTTNFADYTVTEGLLLSLLLALFLGACWAIVKEVL